MFKKGDPACKDNYRDIAVGNVLGKVFSMVLDQRLSQWAEDNGHRAQAEAGFRKGMRTTDQLFILRHVVDKHRLQKKRLFCCFVDFTTGYDSVDRRLLLQRLASLGTIWGKMLTSIAAMYMNVPSHARVDGRVGRAFQSNVGVKQGDPLSLSLLFGLLIDELESFMMQRVPETGVNVGASRCQVLLYADDVVLFAETAADLQSQLDALCVIQSSMVWQSWYIRCVFSEMKILSGCLTYSFFRDLSSDEESCGDVFCSDNEEFELIEVDLSEFGFL